MTKRKARVLVVEDDESIRRILEFQLTEAGHAVTSLQDGESAAQHVAASDVDCVLTDVRMPGISGIDLLRRIGAVQPETPVIVLTAFGDMETAVEALRAGAFDYLTKPYNRDQMLATVAKALRFGAAISENRQLKRAFHERYRIENVVGESEAMRRVLDMAERVAETDVSVLLTGESGTGKEMIARGIHLASPRATGPFVAVNCAAIPESLIESELFGHRKGSFTGATTDATGTFEAASGGTLFLDEIGSMPLSLQPKLLRVLEQREVVRLGESAPRAIDVRVIAATNRDLGALVGRHEFREDLFFRLAVVPIELPPLRNRREDIPLLVAHLLARSLERHRRSGIKLDRSVIEALASHDWPGNVRELSNVIERMVVLARTEVLSLDDLPEAIGNRAQHVAGVVLEVPDDGVSLDDVERELLRLALERHDGNQTRAARFLRITRSALIYRMQKHGLTVDPASGDEEPES